MPYIPAQHEKYNLLPYSRENGGEVFLYPGIICKIQELLPEGVNLYPYGYGNYDEYYQFLDSIIEKYGKTNGIENEVGKYLEIMKKETKELNVKENWAVARYTGRSTGGVSGLTKGQNYYITGGNEGTFSVIDDEEFTSYQYIADPRTWEILEDPTGEARKALKEKNKGVDYQIVRMLEKQNRTNSFEMTWQRILRILLKIFK